MKDHRLRERKKREKNCNCGETRIQFSNVGSIKLLVRNSNYPTKLTIFISILCSRIVFVLEDCRLLLCAFRLREAHFVDKEFGNKEGKERTREKTQAENCRNTNETHRNIIRQTFGTKFDFKLMLLQNNELQGNNNSALALDMV